MQIDWTQTLLGSDGTQTDGKTLDRNRDTVHGHSVLAMRAGRVAGILVAVLLFGLSIATLPLRGLETALPDILAMSGLLVANVIGFGLVFRLGARGIIPAILALGLVPLLAMRTGIGGWGMAALLALIACEFCVIQCMKRVKNRHAHVVLMALIGAVAMIGAVMVFPSPVGLVLMLGIAIPGLVSTINALGMVAHAPGFLNADHALSDQHAAPHDTITSLDARSMALLGVAINSRPGVHLMVDSVGAIDPVMTTLFPSETVAASSAEAISASLIDRVLIADRLPVLQGLSQAIHTGKASMGLTVRLRMSPIGAGYPAPPRFEPHRCDILPASGVAGRAIVMLEPCEAQASSETTIPVGSGRGQVEADVMARAMHDCVSPFNAGLGFLEMLSDPRLAPHDLATYQSYAGEAHRAITEAHRNTVLMGRWLKLTQQDGQAVTESVSPVDLMQDAIRGLNLANREERVELRIEPGLASSRIQVVPDAIRFAMQVLVRGALTRVPEGEKLRIAMASSADDVSINVQTGTMPAPQADLFQAALEQAASGFCAAIFRHDQAGGKTLTGHLDPSGRMSLVLRCAVMRAQTGLFAQREAASALELGRKLAS